MMVNFRRFAAFCGCFVFGIGTSLADEGGPPMQVDHLNVVFSVTDGNAVHEFYGGLLGLQRIADIQLPGVGNMIRYMAGATEVKFIVTGRDLPQMSGNAGAAHGIRLLALLLPIAEQADILERLAGSGRDVDMTVRRTEAGEFRYSFGMVYDGDGNQVEIVFLDESTPEEVFQQAQIGLSVSDLSAMDEFLTHVLRYNPVVTDAAIHRYEMGKSQIKFWQVSDELPRWVGGPSEKIGMNLVQAIVPDVDAVRTAILARGGKIHTEPYPLGSLATIMFVDGPDGILFEFAGPLLDRFKE